MQNSSLQHEIDEWFRRSQSLREEGRYPESMRALQTAAELMDRYTDRSVPSDEGGMAGSGRPSC